MKILHVLYSGLGGHGNIFFAMVSADTKHEFEYEALFYGIEDVRHEFIEACTQKKIPWYFSKKHIKLDIKYYLRIMQLIRKSAPDIIFLHGSAYILPAKTAALLAKKKTRIIVRETQANHLKTKAQWVSLAGSMFFADHIVCLTVDFKEQIQKKLGWLYRKNKVAVISNGINLDIYKPAGKAAGKEIVIGMQSRLVSIKDHISLLKAFGLLKNARTGQAFNLKLRIAGDGDFKEELVKYTSALGLETDVEFTGMIPEKELVGFLQELDIYVHASLGETMSTAIMQAMACKLPIIASDVPGINNMIVNRVTGILVPAQNEQELARALNEFLAEPGLRISLAQNAFDHAQANFSNHRMMELYKQLF